MTPYVESVVLRRKPQSTFCVSVRLWRHSGIHTWVPYFWTWRTLGSYVWGSSGTVLKEQGSCSLVQNMGHKGTVLRPRHIGPGRARTQILFYSILVPLGSSTWFGPCRVTDVFQTLYPLRQINIYCKYC